MLNNERTNGYSIAWEEFFPIRNICPRSHKSLFESLLGLTRTPPMNIMSTLESVYSEETSVISVRELDENGVLLFFLNYIEEGNNSVSFNAVDKPWENKLIDQYSFLRFEESNLFFTFSADPLSIDCL